MEKYFDLLLQHPLFHGINDGEIAGLLHCLSARMVAFPKGAPVFLEGDPAGSIGFVLEGAVEIVHDDFYGNRSLMMVAQAGELFGESFACAKADTMPVSLWFRGRGQVQRPTDAARVKSSPRIFRLPWEWIRKA